MDSETPITEYEVQKDGETVTTISYTSVTVEDLDVRTTYKLRVRAKNGAGWGEWSQDMLVRTTGACFGLRARYAQTHRLFLPHPSCLSLVPSPPRPPFSLLPAHVQPRHHGRRSC